MKLSTVLTFSLSTMLLLSCAQMRAGDVKRPAKGENKAASETVNLDDEDLIQKKGADNHELADADADEESIKKEVGGTEVDEELPGSDKDAIPYSKDFLSLKKTKRMQFWVEYFTKHQRDRFQRFINNGEEYRHHIEKIFVEHGLPKELYFVGLIESGYYLGARSHAAAVGPWQFIRGTAKRYNLRVTHEVDERQDLFKATRAAAMYFKDMHNIFSSWELSLAGYNAGEYGMIRRIMKHGTRDFYQLSRNKQLPSETINYVPKVLAAMHVVNNAEKYGFTIPKKKHHLFDRTVLKASERRTPLTTIARKHKISVALLKRLNPELRIGSIPRHMGTYFLRVPESRYQETSISNAVAVDIKPETAGLIKSFSRPEKKSELNRRTAAIAKPKFHVVKRGETFLSVSRRYKIPAKDLAQINRFNTWKKKVHVGQKIALSSEVENTPRIKNTNGPIVYKVKAGDNLTELARIFNVQLTKLKQTNKIRKGSILIGQKIVLPDSQKGIYVVRKGDHLHKLAKELNQPVEAMMKLNALSRKKIYPGQKLIVNMD